MAATAFELFDAAESVTDAAKNGWAGLIKILSNTDYVPFNPPSIYCTYALNQSTKPPQILRMSEPLLADDVPDDATIDRIDFEIYAFSGTVFGAGVGPSISDVGFNGKTPVSIDEVLTWEGNTSDPVEFGGDLSYWGINNTEALAFIAGTLEFDVNVGMEGTTAQHYVYIDWITCKVTYSTGGGGGSDVRAVPMF